MKKNAQQGRSRKRMNEIRELLRKVGCTDEEGIIVAMRRFVDEVYSCRFAEKSAVEYWHEAQRKQREAEQRAAEAEQMKTAAQAAGNAAVSARRRAENKLANLLWWFDRAIERES